MSPRRSPNALSDGLSTGGDLIRLDLRPDLGAGLNLVIAPFLPKTEAWFDPHDNWKYVGGEFNRYFGGPHVFQVLVPPHL